MLTLGPSVTPCSLVVDTRDSRVLTLDPSVTSAWELALRRLSLPGRLFPAPPRANTQVLTLAAPSVTS